MEQDTRVCPRCGDEAGQEDYCRTCGLHLIELPELPTRGDWERLGPRVPQPPSPVSALVGGLRNRQNRQWLIVGAIGVAAVIGATAVVLAIRHEEPSRTEADTSTRSETDAEQEASVPVGEAESDLSRLLISEGGPYQVKTASCEVASTTGAPTFNCSVSFIGAPSTPGDDLNSGESGVAESDPTPLGVVPPQDARYRLMYDEQGNNPTYSRGAGAP